MSHLIYSAISSLDGFIEDIDGNFDWAEPGPDAHQFVNDLERGVGTYLYGRRMYETMMVWETEPGIAEHSPILGDFAGLWRAADKIVYSTTLEAPSTSRTRIERTFDPEAVRRLKAAAVRDLSIGGPALAAHAFRVGLVDECYLLLAPVVIGAGKRSLPTDIHLTLELQDHRRFDDGMIFLRYRVNG